MSLLPVVAGFLVAAEKYALVPMYTTLRRCYYPPRCCCWYSFTLVQLRLRLLLRWQCRVMCCSSCIDITSDVTGILTVIPRASGMAIRFVPAPLCTKLVEYQNSFLFYGLDTTSSPCDLNVRVLLTVHKAVPRTVPRTMLVFRIIRVLG